MGLFAKKLQELRDARGWTQKELADAAKVPVGSIRNYEQGRRVPTLPVASRLADALLVSLDEMIDGVTEWEFKSQGEGEQQ